MYKLLILGLVLSTNFIGVPSPAVEPARATDKQLIADRGDRGRGHHHRNWNRNWDRSYYRNYSYPVYRTSYYRTYTTPYYYNNYPYSTYYYPYYLDNDDDVRVSLPGVYFRIGI
jgi:hypothetical protein